MHFREGREEEGRDKGVEGRGDENVPWILNATIPGSYKICTIQGAIIPNNIVRMLSKIIGVTLLGS